MSKLDIIMLIIFSFCFPHLSSPFGFKWTLAHTFRLNCSKIHTGCGIGGN
jgi:hypothetical protein